MDKALTKKVSDSHSGGQQLGEVVMIVKRSSPSIKPTKASRPTKQKNGQLLPSPRNPPSEHIPDGRKNWAPDQGGGPGQQQSDLDTRRYSSGLDMGAAKPRPAPRPRQDNNENNTQARTASRNANMMALKRGSSEFNRSHDILALNRQKSMGETMHMAQPGSEENSRRVHWNHNVTVCATYPAPSKVKWLNKWVQTIGKSSKDSYDRRGTLPVLGEGDKHDAAIDVLSLRKELFPDGHCFGFRTAAPVSVPVNYVGTPEVMRATVGSVEQMYVPHQHDTQSFPDQGRGPPGFGAHGSAGQFDFANTGSRDGLTAGLDSNSMAFPGPGGSTQRGPHGKRMVPGQQGGYDRGPNTTTQIGLRGGSVRNAQKNFWTGAQAPRRASLNPASEMNSAEADEEQSRRRRQVQQYQNIMSLPQGQGQRGPMQGGPGGGGMQGTPQHFQQQMQQRNQPQRQSIQHRMSGGGTRSQGQMNYPQQQQQQQQQPQYYRGVSQTQKGGPPPGAQNRGLVKVSSGGQPTGRNRVPSADDTVNVTYG
ncbi:hypothetical protein SARC_02760 [Sphaeroforma arctica JP610]|uniref:Uncharacterized protein n=1 Tax=Sphaeroforma arctica JP610 TaxID=667725 RepID=A0A0L0G7R2_9EUKA|nr:hypothetical protein SARC_02760 [Sphaeroforma arctica JP610]KNC85035.1 hypothetical protein SARC_02760 [Sphaeroforma arctica JP610]|eukprot:XP_014158937.1 hypothetical protein SARC_02760 [Sphaeroforma arctica JP610]